MENVRTDTLQNMHGRLFDGTAVEETHNGWQGEILEIWTNGMVHVRKADGTLIWVDGRRLKPIPTTPQGGPIPTEMTSDEPTE